MAEDLKTLVEMHDLAAECRRVAIDVADREISRKLFRLADELEQHIREATFGHRRKLDG
jgi:replicative DNA helicase